MSNLQQMRELLLQQKQEAAGDRVRMFLPNGYLDQSLRRENISECLKDQSFLIPSHKLEGTTDLILDKCKKIFAILIETRLESALASFIQNEIFDTDIPVREERLKPILNTGTRLFTEHQWEYRAHTFSVDLWVRSLHADCILPYIKQTEIGRGGFSSVHRVQVHPTHQSEAQRKAGLWLARKEINRVDRNFDPKHELELLFLLRHPHIVQLLAAYEQHGRYNLLFPLADMDLDDFMLRESRVSGFEDNRAIFKAMHGLSSGLRYLHNPAQVTDSYIGTHQDIKPKNVLVKGENFILTDFGLSRLKPVEEDSKTKWKDATNIYHAPECRDQTTWVQGRVGRTSDVWSLGCIFCELMMYMHGNAEGVRNFRAARVTQDQYGEQAAFHDGTRLKKQVRDALSEVERELSSSATSSLLVLLEDMFEERPMDRPNAERVEHRLRHITLQALTHDFLSIIEKLDDVSGAMLRIDGIRFRAFAETLGLTSLRPDGDASPLEISTSFDCCGALEDAITNLKSLRLSQPNHRDRDLGWTAVRLCCDTIYNYLSEDLKRRANALFAILCTENTSPEALLAISKLTVYGQPEFENTRRIAATKYMSSMYSQDSKDLCTLKLDRSLVKVMVSLDDDQKRPRMYTYRAGSPDEQKILVEWRVYGTKLKGDMEDKELEKMVEALFRRVQGLAKILRNPQSSGLRVLDCLGTFHEADKLRFGIAYGFPNNHYVPVRLHYLLKGGGSKGWRPPHIGQKFNLAKILAACVRDVHLSGWVHKSINSSNILFFTPPSVGQLGEDDYRNPYLIGFQYSREDDTSAYTLGPESEGRTRLYQHPQYSAGLSSFRPEFDYYSFGLVLLEIGVWECVGNLDKEQFLDPNQFREKCIKTCGVQLLERMGPIYEQVTRKCLETEPRPSDRAVDLTLDFQRDVIDKLEICKV